MTISSVLEPTTQGFAPMLGQSGSLSFTADFAADTYTINYKTVTAASAYTLNRASSKFAPDASGVYSSFANNALARTNAGAVVEAAGTNSIRNNSNTGIADGSPGTQPTNWLIGYDTDATGVTQTISHGTENGLPYTEFRFQGTTGNLGGNIYIQPEPAVSGIVCAIGDTWTTSLYVKLQAGALPGASSMVNSARLAGGGPSESSSNTPIAPSATITRYSASLTIANASSADMLPYIFIPMTAGVAFDFTLRFYAWQEEKAAASSSPILTTSVAVTRAADSLVLHLPAGARHDLKVTFDDSSVQTVADIPGGDYTFPLTLNRPQVKSVVWRSP